MNLLDSGKPPWTAGGWGPPPGKQGLPLVPVRVGSLVTGFWAAPRSCLLQPLPSWDFLLKSLQWPHGTGRSQPSLSGHAHLGLEACGPGGTTVLSSPARRDPACRFTYDLDPGGICALSRRPVPCPGFRDGPAPLSGSLGAWELPPSSAWLASGREQPTYSPKMLCSPDPLVVLCGPGGKGRTGWRWLLGYSRGCWVS